MANSKPPPPPDLDLTLPLSDVPDREDTQVLAKGSLTQKETAAPARQEQQPKVVYETDDTTRVMPDPAEPARGGAPAPASSPTAASVATAASVDGPLDLVILANQSLTGVFGALVFRFRANAAWGDFFQVRVDSDKADIFPRVVIGPQHRTELEGWSLTTRLGVWPVARATATPMEGTRASAGRKPSSALRAAMTLQLGTRRIIALALFLVVCGGASSRVETLIVETVRGLAPTSMQVYFFEEVPTICELPVSVREGKWHDRVVVFLHDRGGEATDEQARGEYRRAA